MKDKGKEVKKPKRPSKRPKKKPEMMLPTSPPKYPGRGGKKKLKK
jgi:hypothetical protein